MQEATRIVARLAAEHLDPPTYNVFAKRAISALHAAGFAVTEVDEIKYARQAGLLSGTIVGAIEDLNTLSALHEANSSLRDALQSIADHLQEALHLTDYFDNKNA